MKYTINSVGIIGVSMSNLDLVDREGRPAGSLRQASVTFSWSGDRGFGEVTITDRGDQIEVRAPTVDKDFLRALFEKLIERSTDHVLET